MKFWTPNEVDLNALISEFEEYIEDRNYIKNYIIDFFMGRNGFHYGCYATYLKYYIRNYAESGDLTFVYVDILRYNSLRNWHCFQDYLEGFENLGVECVTWEETYRVMDSQDYFNLAVKMSTSPEYKNRNYIRYLWAILVRQLAYGLCLGEMGLEAVLRYQWGGGESLLFPSYKGFPDLVKTMKLLDNVELVNTVTEKKFKSFGQTEMINKIMEASQNVPV